MIKNEPGVGSLYQGAAQVPESVATAHLIEDRYLHYPGTPVGKPEQQRVAEKQGCYNGHARLLLYWKQRDGIYYGEIFAYSDNTRRTAFI